MVPSLLRRQLNSQAICCLYESQAVSSVQQVHDSSNAVIAGAKLVLVNVNTHVTSETTTNSAGDYIILNVNPGTYTLWAIS